MKRLLLIPALVLAGCAAVKPAETPSVLRLSPAFPPSARQATGSITVAPVLAGGLIAERRLAYIDRASPHALKQAASQFWDEPPPRLIEHALVAGLGARLTAITGPETGAVADRRLSVRLTRFEEETGGSESPQAVVAFEATLVVNKDRGILLVRSYVAKAVLAGTSANDRAAAFEAAEHDAVDALARDITAGRFSAAPVGG